MQDIIRDLKTPVLLFLAFSLVTGLIYPLLITIVVQTTMPKQAEGSLILAEAKVIGSELLGQSFTSPGYFHGRAIGCELCRQQLRRQQPGADQLPAHG